MEKELEEIIGRAVRCSLLSLGVGRVLLRHIPPGSDAVIHHDSQNQHGSKVGQALTFNEKMRCPAPPPHSFTSSKCTFFFTSLASIFSPPPFFSHLFSPSPPDSISSVALQCNNISFTNAVSCFQFVRASPRLFLRRWKQQRQMDKNYKNVMVNKAAFRDLSVLLGTAWEKTHICTHACYSKSDGCIKKLPRNILFSKMLVRRNPKSEVKMRIMTIG